MKALHMHGEVILCSEDVLTVGAVTNVGLSLTRSIPFPNRKSWGAEILGECSPPTMFPMSHVACHMSCHAMVLTSEFGYGLKDSALLIPQAYLHKVVHIIGWPKDLKA